jgi:hypothetical protein
VRRGALALVTASGLGFLARDLLQMPRAAVALTWLAGALLGLFGLESS